MMQVKITPRLYRVTAITPHDTNTIILTSAEAASQALADIFWDVGDLLATTIDYADESIDGYVNWIESEEV